jgi:hypothetical protein
MDRQQGAQASAVDEIDPGEVDTDCSAPRALERLDGLMEFVLGRDVEPTAQPNERDIPHLLCLSFHSLPDGNQGHELTPEASLGQPGRNRGGVGHERHACAVTALDASRHR